MKQPDTTDWRTMVWAAPLDQDLFPAELVDSVTNAAKSDVEAYRAMLAAGAVFGELLDCERYYGWLESRGFAKPPIPFWIRVSAQLDRERGRFQRRESTRPESPPPPTPSPAPAPRGPAREQLNP